MSLTVNMRRGTQDHIPTKQMYTVDCLGEKTFFPSGEATSSFLCSYKQPLTHGHVSEPN